MYSENAEALRDETLEKYEKYHNPKLAKLLKFAGLPLEWSGEGCYLYDSEGNQYLDFLGGYGVFNVGHRHPRVVDAVKAQLDRMPLSSKVFFSKPLADLAERLAQITPGDLQYSFFVNSGAEAMEGALKLARKVTGRPGFVCTVGGYHGKTFGALSATGREKYRAPFMPLVEGFSHVPYNDVPAMEAAVNQTTAAVVVETVQGEGGIIVPDPGYLPALREICDRNGALLLVDEVQTGLGRTGRMFGVEHSGVVPDIIALAKALGGGVAPAGAFMATPAVWDRMFDENPLLHTSTFGGNPLACAAGLAVIDVIESEGLVERSRVLGDRLIAGLKQVQTQQPELLADVRGQGLMVGVEFAMDEVGELAVANMALKGMVAAYTLNNPRVIRFEPPLIVTEEQVDTAVKTFGEALADTAELLAGIA